MLSRKYFPAEPGPSASQRAAKTRIKCPLEKSKYVPLYCADALDYTICPHAHLCWRFAPRTAVPEQLPVRAFFKDLSRPQPLILAVVPLHKVRIYFGDGSKSC